jgi:uncharacterized protein involved in propanediol utilization
MRRDEPTPPETPHAVRVCGHFGEWLQGRMGSNGPVALITLRCPALAVRTISQGGEAPGTLFGRDTLRRFAAMLAIVPEWPEIVHDMPPGGGAGASTATLVALARAGGFAGDADTLARACLAAEGATDPLMHAAPDRLLWASREARVLRRLPPPPACEVVGGFWGPPERTDPAETGFPEIDDLVEAWARAVEVKDRARAARIAQESSERRAAGRAGPDPTGALARDLGALGHVRAHTGSARGLVFAPGAVPRGAEDALREAGLTGVLRFRTGGT